MSDLRYHLSFPEQFSTRHYRLTTKLAYILSLFDRKAKGMLGYLGMDVSCNNSETRKIFDWTPIPFKQCVLETAVVVKSIQDKA